MSDYSALIIDDDIWMQRILSKTLQSYGFRKTYLAPNGFEGIGLAVEHVPTMIVLDILMPELTGHLTLKVLKSIKITKNIPVVMVSALSDVENLGMAVKAGIAGFISKPFTRSTVYEKLIDVFGQEKLEMIYKGVPIDIDQLYADISVLGEETDLTSSFERTEPITPPPALIVEPETTSKPASQTPDLILKHYQDEEKKSIESIKKLLLKNKK